MNNRIEQLDSIRGLAALVVVFNHLPLVLLTLPPVAIYLIRYLGIDNGHSSVMLFFVLSGFVLSLPFLKHRKITFLPYLVKRVFRIYNPYIFAITVAIVLSQIFMDDEVELVKDWDMLWSTPITVKLILEHIYFLGNIHSNTFNGVIWSLIHELRISIIFPFIVLFIRRYNWKISIFTCFGLSSIAGINNIFELQVSNGYNVTYFATIHYTSLFILGGVLAKYKKEIISFFKKLHISIKCTFLISSYLIYNLGEIIIHSLHRITNINILSTYFYIFVEYLIALGSIGLIISALGSIRIGKFLLIKPILLLGKISYSLYLYHLPVILVTIYLFHRIFPLWIICLVGFFLSIVISTVAWRLIETPTIKYGRIVASKISERKRLKESKSVKNTA
ncbi:acyltransferase family protein [Fredinandcohnia sp. 179-A 10B2 NHS]|uniref:acyltransferase family protein n=1 Tax=Fredinandcohnia sp. 179-A 10B2 NHS TaxID=3235176 RepID=UPI0039A2E691